MFRISSCFIFSSMMRASSSVTAKWSIFDRRAFSFFILSPETPLRKAVESLFRFLQQADVRASAFPAVPD